MELIAVAAVAENGVIGDGRALPWDPIPEDTRQYKARVADWPVLLGRKTFESMLPDPPGRAQIVLSRSDPACDLATARLVGSLDDALDVAAGMGDDRVYVLGGGEIYSLLQPYVDRMYLSRIPGAYGGDVLYPEFDDGGEWHLTDTDPYDEFTVEEWVRRRSAGS